MHENDVPMSESNAHNLLHGFHDFLALSFSVTPSMGPDEFPDLVLVGVGCTLRPCSNLIPPLCETITALLIISQILLLNK